MDELTAKLTNFRRYFPRKAIRIGGDTWEYFFGGMGEPILFLHGGMSSGEMYFALLERLRLSYRVLAPTFPPSVNSITSAVDGVAAILDAEQIEAGHLFGHSQGGYIAQEFAERLPERVRTVMLSSTGLSSPEHAKAVAKQGRIAKFIPKLLFRPAFRIAMSRAFERSGTKLDEEQKRFLLNELTPMPRGKALRRYAKAQGHLQMDYHGQAASARKWEGPVLLLEGGRDGFLSETDVLRLRARYPQAVIRRLAEGGHVDLIVYPDLFVEWIGEFLEDRREF